MSEHVLAAHSLRKEYYETVAVNDLDLAVAQGEIFGLIGPNGAGKTTLLRMLATALEPTGGQACFEGMDIWNDPPRYRTQIGFMPDFFQMYPNLKVGELLEYFGRAYGLQGAELSRRVAEVLRLIDLEANRDGFVRGLSRGMTQRLCFWQERSASPEASTTGRAGIRPGPSVEEERL